MRAILYRPRTPAALPLCVIKFPEKNSSGSPVYLTQNGSGRYVIQEIGDYEKMEATIKLMMELEKGRISGDREGFYNEGCYNEGCYNEGWYNLDEIKKEWHIGDA